MGADPTSGRPGDSGGCVGVRRTEACSERPQTPVNANPGQAASPFASDLSRFVNREW